MTEQPGAATLAGSGARYRPALIGALGFALIIVGAVLGVALLQDDGGELEGMVFTIPEGSRNRVIPELESAVTIPTDIRFGPDDEAAITIVNEDSVAHRAGPFLVGAGQTYVQRFDAPGEYPIACTVDPAESVVVTVEA
jgi:hypothetical protein